MAAAEAASRHAPPGQGEAFVQAGGGDRARCRRDRSQRPQHPPGHQPAEQPFQRLATARSSDGDGHGLGLPIVRAIAAAHGAALATRARRGGGMHVQVSFPASGAAATRREPQTAEARTGIMGL